MTRLCRSTIRRDQLNNRSINKTNFRETVLDTHLLERCTLNIAHYDRLVVISKPPAKLVEKFNATPKAKLV